MISKLEAIKILDDFFEMEYNVDPLYSTNLKAHRLYISENDFFWRLIQSAEEDKYKKEGNIGGIGGGSYFIDKDDGEIYAIGSSPFFNWQEEFNKFKMGEKSEIEWNPKKITYINCEIVNQLHLEYEEIRLKCKYLEKEKVVRDFLLKNKSELIMGLNPKLINKPFESDEGELIVGIKGRPNFQNINLVQKKFTGGLQNYTSTLWDLKKWLRVNGKKVTNNYWIEIEEREFGKEFNNWELKLNLEYQ